MLRIGIGFKELEDWKEVIDDWKRIKEIPVGFQKDWKGIKGLEWNERNEC